MKIRYILTLCLACLVIASCSNDNGDEKVVVGVVLSSLENPFFVDIKENVENEGIRKNVEILVYDSTNSIDTERENIEKLVDEKVDIILINPVDYFESSDSVLLANEKEIPVVAIDRDVESGQVISLIQSDNVEGGKIAGEYIEKVLKGSGNVYLVEGIIGTTANSKRILGIRQALAETDINVISYGSGEFDREKASELTQNLINEDVKVDAVFASNDEMALGVLDVMIKNDKNIIVVGFDGTDEGVKAVVDGYLAATVAQQPDEMAKVGIQTVINILNGDHVDKNIFVPLKLITLTQE